MNPKDPIKDAFSRAKADIQFLKDSFLSINEEIQEIKRTLNNLLVKQSDRQTNQQTDRIENKTEYSQSKVYSESPADDWPYKRLKPHVYSVSTRNGGVPTDRQTNQQTDRQTQKTSRIDHIERVSEILESLDTIKKDLRSKFKHLTKQEILVFSTIYQLEEEGFVVDYSLISEKLALTESSIREYVLKLIKKGIPIQKTKENNKKIILKIDENFKKLASLETLLRLREL